MAKDINDVALMLLAKRKPKGEATEATKEGPDEYRTAKASAVRDLFSALKDDDAEAGAEALAEFVRLCGGK